MAGSHISLIVMPIVIALSLAFWVSAVYWASFHPRWKHQHRPPRTEVAGGSFEATHSGRQLEPLWGEPVEGIPSPREAAGAETYRATHAEAADQQAADQERAASTVGAGQRRQAGTGATATATPPPTESGPTGSGWPPE